MANGKATYKNHYRQIAFRRVFGREKANPRADPKAGGAGATSAERPVYCSVKTAVSLTSSLRGFALKA